MLLLKQPNVFLNNIKDNLNVLSRQLFVLNVYSGSLILAAVINISQVCWEYSVLS